MCKMLLSINPEFVTKILSGDKQYEFRKFRCRDDVDRIVIYATAPMKVIVGEAEIDTIIEGDVLNVWEKTKDSAGISYPFFRQYYKGKSHAYAYRLKNLIIYDKPKTLSDIGVSCAPQSYRYLPA
ncbi:MAG: hypothetical protein E7298_10170 [Lachnospiraceae bacterium]|nr:hypothetical protein [Lachnospiraceae bacterium]